VAAEWLPPGTTRCRSPRRRNWELQAELTEAGARKAVDELQKLSPRPTALLAFNNTFAKLIIDELKRRGLQVPQDLSVMGAGGEEVTGLTCEQADWHDMGGQAVRLLLRHLDNSKSAPEHLLAPTALREGATTSPPAGE